jgi:hypothetical protein
MIGRLCTFGGFCTRSSTSRKAVKLYLLDVLSVEPRRCLAARVADGKATSGTAESAKLSESLRQASPTQTSFLFTPLLQMHILLLVLHECTSEPFETRR